MKYNILTKTPASGWYIIHRNYSLETAQDFLRVMGEQGGYDRSAEPRSYDAEALTAAHYDGGDLIQFRAIEVQQ